MSAPYISFYADLGIDVPDRAGKVKVRCLNPGHEDTRASAWVNTETGSFGCFGCGEKGGAYDAALLVGLSRRDAVELKKKHGLFTEDDSPPPPQKKGPKRTPAPPSKEQLDGWHKRLVSTEPVLRGLAERRGLTLPTIERFGLGYDGERIVLPVRDAAGQVVSKLRYKVKSATAS